MRREERCRRRKKKKERKEERKEGRKKKERRKKRCSPIGGAVETSEQVSSSVGKVLQAGKKSFKAPK